MAVYSDGTLVTGVYVDGTEIEAIYVDGDIVYEVGGLPVIRWFAVAPDKLTIGDSTANLSLTVGASGATSGSITRHLDDGTDSVVRTDSTGAAFNSVSGTVPFTTPNPRQNAHYALRLANANGSIVAHADFLWGRIPTIGYFRTAGFRQGIAGITVDSFLLEWSVTGAVPAANLDITTTRPAGFHYHPGAVQTGSYRYSRQGAGDETLTLTATNAFGAVSQDLAINWP